VPSHNSPKPLLRQVNRSAGAPPTLATRTSCPFYTLFSSPPLVFFYLSNLPMLSPYQPPPQYLHYNGSISQAFFRVPQPLPSRMLRLAMTTLPVPSSFSVVNLKAVFHSSRPICALFLPFLLLSPSSNFHPIHLSLNLNTLTWSTPIPQGATPSASPPPRSAAIGGGDFAAS
jgi:hypothetical protein